MKPKNARGPLDLPASRKDAIVETLRAAILSGDIAPGERLNLDDLAQDYGVSRMPVRDALKQLEAEGLVTIYPHRGVEVSQLDAEDIRELFGIRIALEQKAVEMAIGRLRKADLDAMKEILLGMDGLTGRSPDWIRQNAAFHQIINGACGWTRLIGMIDMLRVNVGRYVRSYVATHGTEVPQKQHWDLYRACADADIEAAKRVIHEHLTAAATELVAAVGATADKAPKARSAQHRVWPVM